MDRLLDIAVLPVWHLLVAHGIAVEAHGQNMVLVHKDGWPVRIMLRDFHESIEFSTDFLADRQNAPDFAQLDAVYRDARPGDFYSTDSLDSLRELVMDTLFIYNLTEVSHLLEEHYGYSETAFWQKTTACLAAYAKRHDLGERQAALGHSAPSILTESLMTRKLLAAQPEYHHLIPNIFAVTG
jgi:siderophore synthetase component